MKLPVEIKTKWVEALRSGDWPQARGKLNSGTGYCCLGVLAEVVEPGITQADPCGDLYGYSTFMGDDGEFVWRNGLAALFESNEALYSVAFDDETNTGPDNKNADSVLMYLNDERRYSFNKLADLIEEHL